jgi:hypothetical protein
LIGASIEFHALSFVPEGPDVVVGRVETGSYAVLPEDGAQLLRNLAAGMSADQAAAWYEETYGEPVDLDDFLESMQELGFIREAGAADAAGKPPRFQRLGRALFSPPAWLLYAALVVATLIQWAGTPNLRPVPSQAFFTSSLTTVELVLMLGQLPMAFLHEAFHVLAGQRLGLHSSLGISNRYTYVVFETRSNGLLSVPRRKRYLPLLAGILLDVVMVCILDLVAAATRHGDGTHPLGGRLCLALSFSVVARIGWQFMLYLRTDLYYVMASALNCYDLHEASKAVLFNRFYRLFGLEHRLVDEEQWTQRDRTVGAWYGWFLVLGVLTALALTVFASGPILLTYLSRTLHGLSSGIGGWHFWDSLVSLLIVLVQFGLPALLARRKRRDPSRRRPRLLAA